MYAVIVAGGKQHKVMSGQLINIEKVKLTEGDPIEFNKVLMVADGENIKIGSPYLKGGKVTGKVESHGRGEKIKIIKFHRRKHYRKQMGHRQDYTQVKIMDIAIG